MPFLKKISKPKPIIATAAMAPIAIVAGNGFVCCGSVVGDGVPVGEGEGTGEGLAVTVGAGVGLGVGVGVGVEVGEGTGLGEGEGLRVGVGVGEGVGLGVGVGVGIGSSGISGAAGFCSVRKGMNVTVPRLKSFLKS